MFNTEEVAIDTEVDANNVDREQLAAEEGDGLSEQNAAVEGGEGSDSFPTDLPCSLAFSPFATTEVTAAVPAVGAAAYPQLVPGTDLAAIASLAPLRPLNSTSCNSGNPAAVAAKAPVAVAAVPVEVGVVPQDAVDATAAVAPLCACFCSLRLILVVTSLLLLLLFLLIFPSHFLLLETNPPKLLITL